MHALQAWRCRLPGRDSREPRPAQRGQEPRGYHHHDAGGAQLLPLYREDLHPKDLRILLALKIESALTKEQILEIYMNQIFLGQRAYGFAAASEIYFGKPLQEVTIAEAAMLAGLPKAPSAYNPSPIPNAPLAASSTSSSAWWRTTSSRLRRANLRASRCSPTGLQANPASCRVRRRDGEAADPQPVRRQTTTRGLVVHVTVNQAPRKWPTTSLRRGLLNYERRQVYAGRKPMWCCPPIQRKWTAGGRGPVRASRQRRTLAAVVLEASSKKVVAVLQSGRVDHRHRRGRRAAVASRTGGKASPKVQIRRGRGGACAAIGAKG